MTTYYQEFIIYSSNSWYYTQKYLLNCFIVKLLYIFPQILLSKPQSCSSFSIGDMSLSIWRVRLFLVVYEACTFVFQLLNVCKTQRESNSQSLRRVATPVFQTVDKKKPPQSKVYLCGSLIQTSFRFYLLHASRLYHLTILLTWVDRYTHACTFTKTISVKWTCAWFKNRDVMKQGGLY